MTGLVGVERGIHEPERNDEPAIIAHSVLSGRLGLPPWGSVHTDWAFVQPVASRAFEADWLRFRVRDVFL
jgi:hypothetical protein